MTFPDLCAWHIIIMVRYFGRCLINGGSLQELWAREWVNKVEARQMRDSVGQAVGAWSPACWLSPAVGRTDRRKPVEGESVRERHFKGVTHGVW